MRRVRVGRPSFPAVLPNQPLPEPRGVLFEPICGDEGHWRAGLFSPSSARSGDVTELETHTCPELFLLLSGRVILLLDTGSGLREIELRRGRPVLVTAAHAAYCPDGSGTGTCLVVERDFFETTYDDLPTGR
jgi:hypothetical protein